MLADRFVRFWPKVLDAASSWIFCLLLAGPSSNVPMMDWSESLRFLLVRGRRVRDVCTRDQ
jgi:hypothetical protein